MTHAQKRYLAHAHSSSVSPHSFLAVIDVGHRVAELSELNTRSEVLEEFLAEDEVIGQVLAGVFGESVHVEERASVCEQIIR